MDNRLNKLAYNLVNYSCRIRPGEKVLISLSGFYGSDLVKMLVKEVYKADGIPYVEIKSSDIERELLLGATKEQIDLIAKIDSEKMSRMDAYIGIGSNDNSAELSDVPTDKLNLYDLYYSKPVHQEIRVGRTKWVVLRYPTNSMAQLANQSLEAFEDFYFKVCNLDYEKMSYAMDNLVELMNRTDNVKIKGKGTDLSFSIKDIPAIKCDGRMNIPDGEVYTAPVKNSVNGSVFYTVPSEYRGTTYKDIKLTFKDGKIIDAECNENEKINDIFNSDEGARYIGEFAIGVNPFIINPMNNILFDEKIMGSFHFTPGNAYKDAFNGNSSSVHWDLVCVQTKEYGGGEIYFDDLLIRKDGLFVIPELSCLNPDNFI